MYKTQTIIAILLTTAGLALSAQSLTLDSCKVLALRNNAAVKNAQLDVEAAQEVKKQAFTKYFPNVSAVGGGYYAANPLFEFGIADIDNINVRLRLQLLYTRFGIALGIPGRVSLCENGVTASAVAMQPIFMGGQIVNGNRLAKVGIEAAQLQSQLTTDQTLQQVEEIYWQTVSLIEKRKTIKQAIIFLDTLQRDVNAAADAGLVTRNDILKVTLKQDEMRSNLLKVENGITLSTMLLCQMIDLEFSDNLTLADTVSDNIASSFPSSADVMNAVLGRSERHLLDLQVKAEQLKKKMAIGATLPHLMIGGTAFYGNPVFDQFSFNAIGFATLQIPLTGWWETAHQIRQQNILIQKAENERTDLMEKMALETRQAWCNLEEARSQVTLAKTSVQHAEANFQESKVNFEAGIIPVSELLEAQTLLLQTQNQLTDALIDLKIKTEKYRLLTR